MDCDLALDAAQEKIESSKIIFELVLETCADVVAGATDLATGGDESPDHRAAQLLRAQVGVETVEQREHLLKVLRVLEGIRERFSWVFNRSEMIPPDHEDQVAQYVQRLVEAVELVHRLAVFSLLRCRWCSRLTSLDEEMLVHFTVDGYGPVVERPSLRRWMEGWHKFSENHPSWWWGVPVAAALLTGVTVYAWSGGFRPSPAFSPPDDAVHALPDGPITSDDLFSSLSDPDTAQALFDTHDLAPDRLAHRRSRTLPIGHAGALSLMAPVPIVRGVVERVASAGRWLRLVGDSAWQTLTGRSNTGAWRTETATGGYATLLQMPENGVQSAFQQQQAHRETVRRAANSALLSGFVAGTSVAAVSGAASLVGHRCSLRLETRWSHACAEASDVVSALGVLCAPGHIQKAASLPHGMAVRGGKGSAGGGKADRMDGAASPACGGGGGKGMRSAETGGTPRSTRFSIGATAAPASAAQSFPRSGVAPSSDATVVSEWLARLPEVDRPFQGLLGNLDRAFKEAECFLLFMQQVNVKAEDVPLSDHVGSVDEVSKEQAEQLLQQLATMVLGSGGTASAGALGSTGTCAICLLPLTSRGRLVSSTNPVCARYHKFHEECLPVEWAMENGCPNCRSTMFDLQTLRMPSPFATFPAPLSEELQLFGI